MQRLFNRRATAAVATTQVRSLYSIWHSTVYEHKDAHTANSANKEATWATVQDPRGTRYWSFNNVPVTAAPAGVKLTDPEQYLLSVLEDDTVRLAGIDWTVEFDSFWRDRIEAHASLYASLYNESTFFGKFFFGRGSAEGKAVIAPKLQYLQEMLKWAEETERFYTAVERARFHMQRDVFDAFEREKIVAGVAAIVDDYAARVPSDFKRKGCSELELQLANMRHWVWDAPYAKMYNPRHLA
jgi:hypothetical protein